MKLVPLSFSQWLGRRARPLLLSVPVLALVVFASGCGQLTVEPSEDVFKGNEAVSNTVSAIGPSEFKIIGQTISEPAKESNFKLESSCAGKTLKPKSGEVLSCAFKVKGENFKGGNEGTLTTEYEDIEGKTTETFCTVLQMEPAMGFPIIRPTGDGKCMPFDYGRKLAKNSTYKEKFRVGVIVNGDEFKIVEVAPGLNSGFAVANNNCPAGTIVKAATPCTFEVWLTPNKNPTEEYETELKLKYKEVGNETTLERAYGRLRGRNTT